MIRLISIDIGLDNLILMVLVFIILQWKCTPKCVPLLFPRGESMADSGCAVIFWWHT